VKRIPKEIHDYVLERDRNRCRICGKPATEVHHIYTRYSHIPDHLGVPKTVSNHHPFNLIAVCHECHVKIHNGKLELDKEQLIRQNQELASFKAFSEELESLLEKLRR